MCCESGSCEAGEDAGATDDREGRDDRDGGDAGDAETDEGVEFLGRLSQLEPAGAGWRRAGPAWGNAGEIVFKTRVVEGMRVRVNLVEYEQPVYEVRENTKIAELKQMIEEDVGYRGTISC